VDELHGLVRAKMLAHGGVVTPADVRDVCSAIGARFCVCVSQWRRRFGDAIGRFGLMRERLVWY
jgi:hypothetical protein